MIILQLVVEATERKEQLDLAFIFGHCMQRNNGDTNCPPPPTHTHRHQAKLPKTKQTER